MGNNEPMRMPKSPCVPECTERAWDCRRHCPKWDAFQKIKDEVYEHRSREYFKRDLVEDFHERGVERIKRRSHYVQK